MTTSSITSLSHVSIAESVFNELASGHDTYYYYYGRTLPFDSDPVVEDVISTNFYENTVRKNIVLLKKINTNDVAHCIPRYRWDSGTVYDMYDDNYHGALLTKINVINGGSNYTQFAKVIIESPLDGISATASPFIIDGVIQYILIENFGDGYIYEPFVTIIDDTGTGAVLESEISTPNLSYNGSPNLRNSKFYIITSSFKVYKCLDNNLNSPSTIEPSSTDSTPFSTADGYIWKFMYSIPNTMQYKWLTSAYMPVTRQLTNSYYSNGGVDTITILSAGSGYTIGSATNAYVYGNGVGAVLRPIIGNGEIQKIEITNGGSDYSVSNSNVIKTLTRSSNVTTCETYASHNMIVGMSFTISGSTGFDGTFTILSIPTKNTFTFSNSGSNSSKNYGTINFTNTNKTISSISRENNIVTVVTTSNHGLISGEIITINGVVTQTDLNGSFKVWEKVNDTTFKYALVGANCTDNTGSVVFNSVGISTIQMSGTSPNQIVTIVCPGKHRRVVGNSITINSNDTNLGNNFTTNVVTVVNDFSFTVLKSGTNAITNSATLTFNTAIDIEGPGSGKYGGPKALASVGIFNGSIYNSGIIDPGTGYSSGDSASVSVSGDGSGLSITPVVGIDGSISSTIINNPGQGYTYVNITDTSSTGSGMKLVGDTNKGNIDTLQYLTEIQAVNGAIYAIKVIDGGTEYTNATAIVTGDGENCLVGNIIIENGIIKKIEISDPGYNYTFASVTITGNGSGANARAIISPKGGHGKDAIKELFGSNLIMHSSLNNNDTIDDILITNDLRQYGILKNPTIYNSSTKYSKNFGTCCFIISGTFSAINYPMDSILKIENNGLTHNFNLIQSYSPISGDSKCIILSIDGYIPEVGDDIILTTDISKHFIISNVTLPEFDQYSGEMIYINNQTPFAQSEAQRIKQRTILSF
jgi:hypothetical protein